MIFYSGTLFRKWNGNILIAGLKSQRVSRIVLKHGRVKTEEWLPIDARVRDIAVGGDGAIYLITDEENGRLLRMTPQ
jgi:aldose sugar dehydrogenase